MSVVQSLIEKHTSPTYYKFGDENSRHTLDEYFCLGNKIFHLNGLNTNDPFYDLNNPADVEAGKDLFEKLAATNPSVIFGNTPLIQHYYFSHVISSFYSSIGLDIDTQRIKNAVKSMKDELYQFESKILKASATDEIPANMVFDQMKYHGDNLSEPDLLELISTIKPRQDKVGNDISASIEIERFGGHLQLAALSMTENFSKLLSIFSVDKDIMVKISEREDGALMMRYSYQTIIGGFCISNLDKYPAVINLLESKIDELNLYGRNYDPGKADGKAKPGM